MLLLAGAAALVGGVVKGTSSELLARGRANLSKQAFLRRLTAYGMSIEQQRLFREDIRDLVELSVGRMDVFQVVAALLLAVAVLLYTKNAMLEDGGPEEPPWALPLFLISNLGATGYLMFATWLSMHAAVASHAVGVRLLTSFARLSIPKRAEIDAIREPLLPVAEWMATQLQVGSGAAPSPLAVNAAGGAQAAGSLPAAGVAASGRPDSAGSGADAAGAPASAEGDEAASGDRRHHLRRFRKEQGQWLSYDVHARICITLGAGQLLTAISYYLIGNVRVGRAPQTVLAAIGLQTLAFFLCRLDIRSSRPVRVEVAAAICLGQLSPVLVGFFAWIEHSVSYAAVLRLSMTVAYVLHGFWLLYNANRFGLLGADDLPPVPTSLRVVLYLDVLQLGTDAATAAEPTQETWDGRAELRATCAGLERAMQGVVDEEQAKGSVSAARRNSGELQRLQGQLQELVQRLRTCCWAGVEADVRKELLCAEQVLDMFTVWCQAPEIHSSLEALRKPHVQDFLCDDRKFIIEQSYQAFLRKCKELNLGITQDGGAQAPAAGGQVLIALAVAEGEEQVAHVHVEHGDQPTSLWIDAAGHELQQDDSIARSASFGSTFTSSLPQWTSDVMQLAQRRSSQDQQILSLEEEGPPAQAQQHEHRHGRPRLPLIPHNATPPEELPRVIVRRFTCGLSLLWILGGCAHLVSATSAVSRRSDLQRLRTRPLSAPWLEAAGTFTVASLHCNDSVLLLGDRFSLRAARRLPDGRLEAPVWVGSSNADAVLCSANGCEELHSTGPRGGKQLSPLPPPWGSSRAASVLAAPARWQLASMAWLPCAPVPCEAALLAGWDGNKIIVAGAQRQSQADAWHVEARFAVRASSGPGSSRQASCSSRGAVRALQLDACGRTLLVLHDGGLLDGWDLVSGVKLGCWSTGGQHTAMCHDGREVVLARQGATGPLLEVAPLPGELWDACGRGMAVEPSRVQHFLYTV